MATTLKIQFLTGRYHATPWNSTPNEGVAEPFPTPWRILCALVAAGYRWESPSHEQLVPLFERLGEQLPRYYVPPAREGHVRQSVPVGPDRGEPKPKRRLLDAFRVFGAPFEPEAAVWVQWPVSLTEAEQAMLAELAPRVSYLGRSESWVAMELVAELPGEANAEPLGEGEADPEATTVMAPLAPAQIAALSPQGLTRRQRSLLPTTVWEALDVDYNALQQQRWNAPPGSRFAPYRFQPQQPVRQWQVPKRSRQAQPTVAHLRLDASVLPPSTALLEVTDRVHRELTKLSDGHWLFSGKRDGQPVRDNQGHAQFLPQFDRRGKICGLWLYASAGLDEEAVETLYRLRPIRRSDERHWYWTLTALPGRNDAFPAARTWESEVPFVAARWPKRERDSIPNQVRAGCRNLGLPEPEAVEPLAFHELNRSQRARRKVAIYRPGQCYHRVPSERHWLRLVFPETVRGPIALGWNAHYGLGTFRACAREGVSDGD